MICDCYDFVSTVDQKCWSWRSSRRVVYCYLGISHSICKPFFYHSCLLILEYPKMIWTQLLEAAIRMEGERFWFNAMMILNFPTIWIAKWAKLCRSKPCNWLKYNSNLHTSFILTKWFQMFGKGINSICAAGQGCWPCWALLAFSSAATCDEIPTSNI